MIKVVPIQEKSEQERLCALCRVPFETLQLAYGAYGEDGTFCGICQFYTHTDGGHIAHLAAPDESDPFDALFVLGRAALNFIDLCGFKHAFFDGETAKREALLRRIGFSADKEGRYAVSLDGFFTHPCQHC